jgi:hypothetical protein
VNIEVGKNYIAENSDIIEILYKLNPEWTGYPFIGYSHKLDIIARYSVKGEVDFARAKSFRLIKEAEIETQRTNEVGG